MSYCRFSSDDFRSDVYAYEAEEGIVIHVARSRLELTEPLPEAIDVRSLVTEHGVRAFLERNSKVHQIVEAASRTPIEHPDAGVTMVCGGPDEAYRRLTEMSAQGIRVPDFALAALADEAGITRN